MKNSGILLLPAGLLCLLVGCSQYQSKALIDEAVQQQLETPAAQQLSIQAGQIRHPLLKPVPFNIEDGLSPDEAAILAVLRNPELRAARDHHGIANAQLLQAGLLPNPTLSYNFAALSGGLDQGKVTGLGLGLGWEVTSLITQSNKLIAAEAEQQSVDLHIAWQEWQIAQGAKTAFYQLLVYSQQQLLLEEMLQRLESNRVRIQQAADEGSGYRAGSSRGYQRQKRHRCSPASCHAAKKPATATPEQGIGTETLRGNQVTARPGFSRRMDNPRLRQANAGFEQSASGFNGLTTGL